MAGRWGKVPAEPVPAPTRAAARSLCLLDRRAVCLPTFLPLRAFLPAFKMYPHPLPPPHTHQAKAGLVDAAFATYEAMLASSASPRCRPTSWTFCILVAACGRAGQAERAADVVTRLMPQVLLLLLVVGREGGREGGGLWGGGRGRGAEPE